MYNQICSYIRSCDACQRQNHKLTKTSAALHPIRVEGEAWNQLGMDLVGPLHTTPRGNKYIMTIMDYYTKWAEAEPLKDKTAASVSSVLYTLFCRFGCPSVIISDQGREFVNNLTSVLFKKTNTHHRITSAYHPQTNGLTEKFNQTLSRSLAKLVNDEQDDWDVHLETILCSYRASKQKSTGYSPFYLMFHRHPRLPIDSELKQSEDDGGNQVLESKNHEAFIDGMLQVQEEIRAQTCKNIEEAQQMQKEYYDRRHLPEEIQIGTKVLVENTQQKNRKGGKLDDKYKGPYIIQQSLGKGVYTLKSMDGKVLKTKHNIQRLKVFTERKPSTDPESQSAATPLAASGSESTTPPSAQDSESTTPPSAQGSESTTPPPAQGSESTTPPSAQGSESTTPPPAQGSESTTPPSAQDSESTTLPRDSKSKPFLPPQTANVSPTATTSVLSPSPPTSAISVTSHSPPALANTPALVPANPGLLIEQLQDDNLLRLWRTGANYEVYTSEEDGDVDMSHLFESVGDYALSKDVDVALWLDCRAFNKKEPLRDALDFVIVNTSLHDDFDEFKRNEIQSGYSYLQMNELLQHYIDHGCGHLKQHIITRYGLTYLKLDGDQIDHLCRWIKVKRDCIRQDGFVPSLSGSEFLAPSSLTLLPRQLLRTLSRLPILKGLSRLPPPLLRILSQLSLPLHRTLSRLPHLLV